MGFVKIVKNKAYYKRFQVKFLRRRQAKTDYYARKRLVWNDKNKYDTPKYRLVVRFTNRDVIAQVVNAGLTADNVVVAAYGHELARYGLKVNFNNYPAAYATGLLLARKVNAKMNLPYTGLGSGKVTGEYFNLADAEKDGSGSEIERKPFKAYLDVGLRRTTTGARIFAVVKGACDGGINVPHSPSRFVGAPAEKGAEVDFEKMKKHIFGGNIREYMELLQSEDAEKFDTVFSGYKKAGVKPSDLEALFTKVHAAIRADKPADLLKKNRDVNRHGYFKERSKAKDVNAKHDHPKDQLAHRHFAKGTRYNKQQPISKQQRKARIYQKLRARAEKLAKAKAELARATGIGQKQEVPTGKVEEVAKRSDSESQSSDDE